MNGIKIDFEKGYIIVNKTFSKKMANPTSDEYKTFERVKTLNPDFKLKVVKQETYNHEKYKGLTYKVMIAYIYCHELDEESRDLVYSELIEEKWKAMGHTCGFHEVRAWFLQKYPNYDHMYFQKHEQPPKTIIDRILKACDTHSGGKLLENKDIRDMIGKDYENICGMVAAA